MFDVKNNTPVFLYGYSTFDLAVHKFDSLKNSGYSVVGYIDRNALELKTKIDEPIWTPDEICESKQNLGSAVVIILLQNGQLHEQVAGELNQIGFQNILYLPWGVDTIGKQKMYGKYNLFLEEDFTALINIPTYIEIKDNREFSEEKIDTEYITVKVPVNKIYTYQGGPLPEAVITKENVYFELYDYLTGKRKECRSYLNFIQRCGDAANRFLEDRKQLYLFFEKEYRENTPYFQLAAPHASWNKKGYYNIIDGLHRATYLAYKNEKEIYLRVRKDGGCYGRSNN